MILRKDMTDMLTDYKVKAITYPNGMYLLGKSVPVIDEGGFYRIDGTHIFDKFKIESIDEKEEQVILTMKDRTVILGVEAKS